MRVDFRITLFPSKNKLCIIILLFYFVFTYMHVNGLHDFILHFVLPNKI
jgi:hypothetical protein